MCFVFIRFHRASRRDEVCDKFCVFNFFCSLVFCSLVFYSLLINQFCVFREFRMKQIYFHTDYIPTSAMRHPKATIWHTQVTDNHYLQSYVNDK